MEVFLVGLCLVVCLLLISWVCCDVMVVDCVLFVVEFCWVGDLDFDLA